MRPNGSVQRTYLGAAKPSPLSPTDIVHTQYTFLVFTVTIRVHSDEAGITCIKGCLTVRKERTNIELDGSRNMIRPEIIAVAEDDRSWALLFHSRKWPVSQGRPES